MQEHQFPRMLPEKHMLRSAHAAKWQSSHSNACFCPHHTQWLSCNLNAHFRGWSLPRASPQHSEDAHRWTHVELSTSSEMTKLSHQCVFSRIFRHILRGKYLYPSAARRASRTVPARAKAHTPGRTFPVLLRSCAVERHTKGDLSDVFWYSQPTTR